MIGGTTAWIFGVAFGLSLFLGYALAYSRFCTLGAVIEGCFLGGGARLGAWMMALMVAMVGVEWLKQSGVLLIDTRPPYLNPTIYPLRHVVGGLLFGVGMFLANGCPSRQLVYLGLGSVRALIVITVIGVSSWVVQNGLYDWIFWPWISLVRFEIVRGDGTGGDLEAILGIPTLWIVGLGVISGLSMLWRYRRWRRYREAMGGWGLGFAIVGIWWLTGGVWGQEWQLENDFALSPSWGVATQSLTFVSPLSDSINWGVQHFELRQITIGMVIVLGIVMGAAIFGALGQQWACQQIPKRRELLMMVLGSGLMGIGGVLGLGCSVGQGVTGLATLSLGSFISASAMVFGVWFCAHILESR